MHEFTIPAAYTLLKREEITDVQSTGYLLRHNRSGARVMLLANEDDNKVFNIAFRTTPQNSTGVAHIMEHTVLCGSRKFPVKDPFVELAKGSMNTFLNAMTYPDKTMYPVASCNDKDFTNLMEVYLDAVFYPNIYLHEEIFRQEGWHYQLEKPEDPIEYNGVVYNEMKGAFSSPDDVVEREIMNSLFPDTTYHHESGGDPADIPELSYEEYLDFHRTYYHPSNSYIYLYGRMDFEERLRWLDTAYLGSYEAKRVDSAVPLQKPFEQMVTVERSYPIGRDEEERDNTYLAWNAVIGTSLDTKLTCAFAILDYALLGMPGAPLKQALLDEGIGRDILSSFDSGILQPIFSVIAKNANGEDRDRFVAVIRKTLERIAAEGVDRKAILAAINTMEFRFREADYGNYPKGLMYGIDVFDSWLYDDDAAFAYLKQLDDFAFMKAQIGTGYYETLIRRYLLDNSHVSLLVAAPERDMTARVEKETARKLADFKASLSEAQIGELVEKTARLRAFQETPSPQEDLEKIPMLTREDLRREALSFKNEIYDAGGACLVHHDYDANGIAYVKLLLDASGVPQEDLPYLGLLKSVLGYVNTAHYSYTDLFNEINIHTGGISAGVSVFPDAADTARTKLALGVQIRTLFDRLPYCFEMAREILFTSDLTNDKRLLEILRKNVSRVQTKLSEAGSGTASTRSMAGFSALFFMNDSLSGVRYYDTVKALAEDFEGQKEALKAKLRRVLDTVLTAGGLLVSYTGDAAHLEEVRALTAELARALHTQADRQQPETAVKDYPAIRFAPLNEGILTPAKVQYVARVGNFRQAGFAYTGALKVLRTIMSYEYLWSNVRVVGGAYGCSGMFFRNGDAGWVSYRDPQLSRTMEVYEGVPDYLETFEVSDRDMTKYVIGTVSDMDTPLMPSALGSRSLNALLGHLSLAQLQQERDQVLAACEADIRALAPLTRAVLAQRRLCVLGNENRLREESALFEALREL